jgi:hypothetical protein
MSPVVAGYKFYDSLRQLIPVLPTYARRVVLTVDVDKPVQVEVTWFPNLPLDASTVTETYTLSLLAASNVPPMDVDPMGDDAA